MDYTGEPMLRAALVDALRERRRGRDLRGLDTGELDLSRIGPTALGLDLDRAFARRIRPDVRGVAVAILVDASSSMNDADGRGKAAKRGACLAYRALTRERIAVSVSQYGAPAAQQWAEIVRFGAPQSQAMQALHAAPDWRRWGTDAPTAVGRAVAGLELWPILLGAQAARGLAQIESAGWSSIPPIVAEDPAELVPTWTRAMRAHLGRVAQ